MTQCKDILDEPITTIAYVSKIEALGDFYKQKPRYNNPYTNGFLIWRSGPQVTLSKVLAGLKNPVVASRFDALAHSVIGSRGDWVRDSEYSKSTAIISLAFRFGTFQPSAELQTVMDL